MLEDQGIHPLNRSDVEHEFLTIMELLEFWKNPNRNVSENVLRTGAGVHDFAAKVLAARHCPEFPTFQNHLELVAKGTVDTAISQMAAGAPDDTARKLVELYVACLAIHCGENIALDHPVSSKGDNPDILLDYGSKRWAIAIKTTSSKHGQTLYENIKKAAEQIERCDADSGLVLLNVKNSIDHDSLWQKTFTDQDDAIANLRQGILGLLDAADHEREKSDWDRIFAGKKTVLPVMMMAQSVVRLPTKASAQTPTPIKMLVAGCFDRQPDSEGLELATCLSHCMQTILRGEPGPPPR